MKFGKWISAARRRNSRPQPPVATATAVSESREDAVERAVQQRELANFWQYDGGEQMRIDREYIARQLY